MLRTVCPVALSLILALLPALLGCSDEPRPAKKTAGKQKASSNQEKKPGGKQGKAEQPPPSPKSTKPITEADAIGFAKQFCDATRQQKLSQVKRMFDMDAMIRRMRVAKLISEEERDTLIQGTFANWDPCEPLGLLHGKPEALRYRTRSGMPVVIVRNTKEGGFDYFDLVLARNAAGKVSAVDAFAYKAGENLSETFSRAMLPIQADLTPAILGKLTPDERIYMQHSKQIVEFMTEIPRQSPESSLKRLNNLPAAIRNSRLHLAMRGGLAQRANDLDQFVETIQELRRRFPSDPGVDMIAVDCHVLRNEFDEAIACCRRFKEAIGGDPVLDQLEEKIAAEADK